MRNLDDETHALFLRAMDPGRPALSADETERLLRGVLRASRQPDKPGSSGTEA